MLLRVFGRRLCCSSADTLDAELGLRRTLTKQLARVPRRQQQPETQTGAVARVSTVPLKPGSDAALVSLYSSEARSLYEATPGFIGSVMLLNDDRTVARSITLWSDAARMHAATEQPGYPNVMGQLAQYFADVPDLEIWQLASGFVVKDANTHLEELRLEPDDK